MRKTVVFLMFLLYAASSWGQNHCMGVNPQMCTNYQVVSNGGPESGYTFSSNLQNAKTINVWHLMSGSPALVGMASGYDSTGMPIHFGWTSAHQVWEYVDYFAASYANSWIQQTELGTAVIQLAIGNGTIYSLQSTSYCTNQGSGVYGIFSWNGSSWTQPSPSSCLSQFGGAQDGTLVGVNLNGYLYESTNGGTSWQEIAAAGSGWKYVTPANSTYAVAVKTNNEIYSVSLPDGATIDMNGQTTVPPAIDSNSNTYVVGLTNHIYYFNSSNAWDELQGTGFVYVSTCGSLCTIGLSGSTPYRLPDSAMSFQATLSGNTACTPTCTTSGGIKHTKTITVKFNHGSYGGQTVVGQQQTPGIGETAIAAQDTTWDMFDCMDNPDACFTSGSLGTVNCTAVGLIFSTYVPHFPTSINPSGSGWKIAWGRVDTGDPSAVKCFNKSTFKCGNKGGCTYRSQFNYYCDQGVNPTPPIDYFLGDSTVLGVTFYSYVTGCSTDGNNPPGPDPNLWGFDISGPCYYPGPGLSPLLCLHDPLPGGAGAGPISRRALFINQVPKNTKGPCTISGNLQ